MMIKKLARNALALAVVLAPLASLHAQTYVVNLSVGSNQDCATTAAGVAEWTANRTPGADIPTCSYYYPMVFRWDTSRSYGKNFVDASQYITLPFLNVKFPIKLQCDYTLVLECEGNSYGGIR